jgi:hypothetical protein
MNPIKDLKFVILFIIVILALVIVRTFDKNLFKQYPSIAVEAAQNDKNLITQAQLEQLKTPFMVVDLGSEDKFDHLPFKNIIRVPFEKLLEQSNRKILEDTKDDIILYSSDSSTAAKAWIILNQLGIKRLFILTTEEKSEILKYKFQPDTTVRLEQDSM